MHKIPETIKNISSQAKGIFEMKIWETEGALRPEVVYHGDFRSDKGIAFVVISEGCSNSLLILRGAICAWGVAQP